MRSLKRWSLIASIAVVLAAAAWFFLRSKRADTSLTTAQVDRGDIVEVVGATGALQAVTTVQVGSQVSGTIQSLEADFNKTVHKGQVVARLDPSLFEARLGQSRASLVAARANVDRGRAAVEDARLKYERARNLHAQTLLADNDLETAKTTHDSALAQLKANEAAVTQAEAAVNQAEVDLTHTVIRAPIDGIVINRSVDVGQTVAASFTAPVLFVIANDLSKMQVNAAIDEADIGRVQEGQDVTFKVDAYPDRDFPGRVEQIRLQPTTVQNVVTYNTIIAVDNPKLLLKPGMTATVSVISKRADGVLRMPSAALRYRPPDYNPDAGRAARPTGGVAEAAQAGTTVRADTSTDRRGGRQGGAARAEGRQGAGREGGGGGQRSGRTRRSTIFVLDANQRPVPREVVLGLSDGQRVEVVEGLAEGETVVTGSGPTAAARPAASPSGTSPFQPQFQRRTR